MTDQIPAALRSTRPARRPGHRLGTRVTLAALLAAGIATGCAACSDPPPSVLDSVGRVDGSPALIAVQARDGNVTAYVCDGDSGLGERFSGPARDGVADLRTEDGATLHVQLTADGAEGTVTAGDGAPSHFTTATAKGPDAGWYAASAPAAPGVAALAADWIELDDGTQNGLAEQGSDGSDWGQHHHKRHHGRRAPKLTHSIPHENAGEVAPQPGTGIIRPHRDEPVQGSRIVGREDAPLRVLEPERERAVGADRNTGIVPPELRGGTRRTAQQQPPEPGAVIKAPARDGGGVKRQADPDLAEQQSPDRVDPAAKAPGLSRRPVGGPPAPSGATKRQARVVETDDSSELVALRVNP